MSSGPSLLGAPGPVRLFSRPGHEVYWVGLTEETAFRCNAYIIVDGDRGVLFDPGGRQGFEQVRDNVAKLVDPARVTAMVLSHEDPDVAASMVDWLDTNPEMKVISSARAHVLLSHYGRAGYDAFDICENPVLELGSGSTLRFIEAPFLHFPGAFLATYDTWSAFLMSGDAWATLDFNWHLFVEDWDEHVAALDLFHIDYMASNVAAHGFAGRLAGLDIRAILPQHGSVIPTAPCQRGTAVPTATCSAGPTSSIPG